MKQVKTSGMTAAAVLIVAIVGGAAGGAVVMSGGESAPVQAPAVQDVDVVSAETTEEATAAPSPAPTSAPVVADEDEAESTGVAPAPQAPAPAEAESAKEAADRSEQAAKRSEDAAERAEDAVEEVEAPVVQPEPAKPSKPFEVAPACQAGQTSGTSSGDTYLYYRCEDGKWVLDRTVVKTPPPATESQEEPNGEGTE